MGYAFRRMTRLTRLLVCALAIAAPSPALAQRPPAAGAPQAAPAEAQTEDQAEAQKHFQRAKDLYQAGSYREAIAELEQARSLDPKAKELVFNLGIVHEKLAQYDEAISWFRQYQEMEGVTEQERAKAESIIKRIEGAKRELKPQVAPTPGPSGGGTTEPPPPPPAAEPPARGRIDAATIAAASVAVVGLGVGTAFGIRAVTTRPDDFVTGRDGSFQDLQKRTDDAHTSAVIADVGFAVGAVATLATAYLYFGRTKEPQPTSRVGASPTPGGGLLLVGGTFR